MIAHVVLLQPKPDLSFDDRRALLSAFERAVREIPSVLSVRVGRRILHGAGYETSAPASADYLIVIDFADISGLQAYLRHPAHEELGTRLGQAVSSVVAYDFEVGGMEE